MTVLARQDCMSPIDLVLALDSSESITATDQEGWTKVKNFTVAFTRRFKVSQMDTRVGLTVFSDYGINIIHLNTHDNAADLEKAIIRVEDGYGFTYTSEGLWAAARQFRNSTRPDVPNIVIVITESSSEYDTWLPEEATNLKKEATVIAVGVPPFNFTQLNIVASSQDLVFEVPDFDDLSTKLAEIVDAVCRVAAPGSPMKIIGTAVGAVLVCALLGLFIGLAVHLYRKRQQNATTGNEDKQIYENQAVILAVIAEKEGAHTYENQGVLPTRIRR